MQLIDTHAHLNDEKFKDDIDQVVSRAKEASVDKIIVCGYDIVSSRIAIKLANKYESIYATVGIHPHDATNVEDATISLLEEMARNPKVVAIGEIGLDYHYDFSPRKIQTEVFERQIDMAAKLKLPIVIHCRESNLEAINILSNAKKIIGGVFHCYSGDEEILQKVLALGMYIGIDGPITYRNSEKMIRALHCCPLNRLLLETDCPYLTPEPLRGKRNEPSYLPLIAEKVAGILGISTQYLATVTTQNARALFGKKL